MKKLLFITICLAFIINQQSFSQTETNVEELLRLSEKFRQKWEADRQEVINYSQLHNIRIRIEDSTKLMEMQYIDESGNPQYYMTENRNASATISTNRVNSGGSAGLSLDGSGMTVHEWDGGGVLTTHQEFGSRVTMGDGTSGTHYHSTHVAGTMIAAGVDPYAKGMAPLAELEAYDWNSDDAEMAAAAAAGALVSNHSYGYTRGWAWNGSGWDWYGNTGVSVYEDYKFGFYDSYAADWDEIAYNAPYYLICKSSGNDRGDGPGSNPPTAEIDGGSDGYDCIGSQGVAKNILTVGAVEDIPVGYTQPSDVVMSSFSSWGPADDGRIKPDVVGNGIGLFSTYNGANDDYNSISGTSMATPNVAGSLILLQEHYEDLNGSGSKMRAATLKALVIHTADEAGSNTGPDYKNGWGLVNIEKAAAKITEDDSNDDIISEHTLTNSPTYTTTLTATSGYPIKVTICWTDPKGTPPSPSVNPSDIMLVNDLDLTVEDQSSTTYYPYMLDRNNPSNAATTGDNDVDNVEVVYIENPTAGETYTITVDNDGPLSGGSQAFSMIISGYAVDPDANFYSNTNSCGLNETVYLTDVSTENPTSWSWSISPSTYTFVSGTSATSQNPEIEFTASGNYDVSLTVTNAVGNDTELKAGYVSASDAPTGYCDAWSTNPAGNIENFSFAGVLNYHTGYTDAGGGTYYQDFTNIMIDVDRTGTYSLYVHNGYDGSGEDLLDLAAWIDFNRDGDFSDAGEQVVCDIDDYGEGTFSVTIPASASLGATRLRLRTKYSGSSCPDPCNPATANGEVEDYIVNISPAPTLPPEADFSADDTTPAVGATVNFTDLSSNIPTSWLWTFDPATVTYVGGTSSSSQNPQVQFTAVGSYDVTLYAENAYGNDTETKLNYIVASVNYCTASGGGDEYIDGVQIGTINNTGTGASGYADYTAMSTDLELLSSNNITITNGNSYAADDLGIWIDLNQDGDFDDTDENVVCTGDDGADGIYSFTVPSTANMGSTRMRIRIKWSGNDCGSSCGTTTYGEVEDYTVNITTGTLTWDGSESTDWDDPDNWDGGVVPTSSFNVIIPDTATVPNSPVIYNGTIATCANLTLETDASLTSDGELTLTGP